MAFGGISRRLYALQVGSEVAKRGLGLGFSKVIAYDPYASAAKAAALGVALVTFDEALRQGDFFSLHMPLTEGTRVGYLTWPAILHAANRYSDTSAV